MALAATRLQVHNAIVAAIETASGIGNVYNRVRRPLHDTEGQIQSLFNDSNSILNVVFVRYIGKINQVSSFDDLISVSYIFELEVRYAWNEKDDADSPSELIFNALLDSIGDVFTADKNIGFGDAGVSTNGLEILRPIERDPTEYFAKKCHTAYPRLVVSVSEC
jgi:hypothetical protein